MMKSEDRVQISQHKHQESDEQIEITRLHGGSNDLETAYGGKIKKPENRIQTLQHKHQKLDEQIETARRHSGSDDLETAEMKKAKLLIKDEIRKLQEALKVI